jgi:hypothetical protein
VNQLETSLRAEEAVKLILTLKLYLILNNESLGLVVNLLGKFG